MLEILGLLMVPTSDCIYVEIADYTLVLAQKKKSISEKVRSRGKVVL